MNKLPKAVFFGSGPLAAASLSYLLKNGFVFSAVITKPKPDHGHISSPPVETVCKKNSLAYYCPASKQELAELFIDTNIDDFYGLVIDYGLIIPQSVIDHFKMGIINSHFSLLPLLRGADPITYAILEGTGETGVSLMVINQQMDEGELIAQEPMAISPDETAKTLTDKLLNLSLEMLADKVPKYLSKELRTYPQSPDITPTYSKKLIKEDGQMLFDKTASRLEREVRAYIEWPKSYATLPGNPDIEIVVTEASVYQEPGTVGKINIYDGKLLIYCKQDALNIDRLKVSGKPEMDAKSFINGYKNRLIV